MSYLINIENCIQEKLFKISIDNDLELKKLQESYFRRKQIIKKCYTEYDNRYSHVMYYAYKGVVNDVLGKYENIKVK